MITSVIGGMYTFAGPVVGAFVYQFGHDNLVRYVPDWQLVLGAVLLLVVLARPDGLVGVLSPVRRRASAGRAGEPAGTEETDV